MDVSITNRAKWRKKLISYTGDPPMTGQARDEEDEEEDVSIT